MTRIRRQVALVHDYWISLRGGERIFLGLRRLFPEADLYTLIHGPNVPTERGEAPPAFHPAPLRWVPGGDRHHRALLPLYPLAARTLDLRGYDLVISSSSGFCHGARTDGAHLCYCYTPLRYAWHEYAATISDEPSRLRRAALRPTLSLMRRMDYAAAQRVTHYVAISIATQKRIAEFYGRTSAIVHPFIDTDRYHPVAAPDDYLLVVSQLLPYKRADLAVAACARLGRRLVVVGEGPERARLEALAGPRTTFAGRVSEAELTALYAGCAALLQCGVEDFGMAALEAQASGRPVVAFAAAGALETVVDGISGVYFHEQTVERVVEAIERLDRARFDPLALRAHAEHFDEAHFRAGISAVLRDAGIAPALRGHT
ncbi:MAG TPA: glycosyltransferase [Ktedonobacterales bacterium]|nr:glycosyltransferase [Ktedonobacterales bacterium]